VPGHLNQHRIRAATIVAVLLLSASAFSKARPTPSTGGKGATRGGDPIVEEAHMRMTALTQPAPGDAAQAAEVLAALRTGLEPYADYHRALADGFTIFAPNLPQRVYHFSNRQRALVSAFHFNPAEPTSLLYEKTSDGYRLIGAMYTAPRWVSLAELNKRVPLSMAQWHEHTNWCLPKQGEMARLGERNADGRPLFGGRGTITTGAGCSAAGGRFFPQAFGWMLHIYPFASNEGDVWGGGREAMHEMAGDHGMGMKNSE
jgi:hypothetical protein